MLARDASLGVTHAIYAPQNTLRSSLKDVSDNWGWEGECINVRPGLAGSEARPLLRTEALWIELGEHIREGKWVPGESQSRSTKAVQRKQGDG